MRKTKNGVLSLYVSVVSILSFIGGGFAIYFSFIYGYSQWQAYQSQHWPHTTAVIEKIDFISSKHKSKTIFHAQIDYRYFVAHQVYRGEYQSSSTDTLAEQQEQWAAYSVGGPLSVAYQSFNPSVVFTRFDQHPWWLHAIKSVGLLLFSLLVFCMGSVLCLSMLGITYKEPRASKRERADSQRECRENAIARKKAQGSLRKKA
ncbi:DUF3592 domain-containing protein [Iodobacter arcticus]|uniref:DUF3592 domain-containing protein n=1 Tax=Iodobacter arcticus TaxID=590593 RepID=A0ABW2R2T7_9NEIS